MDDESGGPGDGADRPDGGDGRPRPDAVGARQDALIHATSVVGDRWTLLLVDALLAGPARYSDLEDRVRGISPNVLSSRLKQLEGDGLVVAEPYQQRPVRHDYRLTDRGRALATVLDLLAAWGDDAVPPPAHGRCGTPLAGVLWCPTCEELVGDPDDDLVHL